MHLVPCSSSRCAPAPGRPAPRTGSPTQRWSCSTTAGDLRSFAPRCCYRPRYAELVLGEDGLSVLLINRSVGAAASDVCKLRSPTDPLRI